MVVPGLVFPVLTSVFIDRVVVDGDQNSWVVPGCWHRLLALAAALQVLLEMAAALVPAAAARPSWCWLMASALLLAPAASCRMTFFTQRAPGEIGWRLMLNDNVAGVITGDLARAVVNAHAGGVLLCSSCSSFDVRAGADSAWRW
jgi:ABC-type bacteriocin/lantibiotic exporter with double-glycine peptidase domain